MNENRCAVYTRKSVEDGLEQEFNSLDAQREAGENYIASQKHNGWRCLPERYDDGGWSGGNMERPALKRLMDDIAAGKIDTVVCYKIDRLSRSLIDFAEMLNSFEKHKTNFVSVTQEINTSSSSGRMMLNILMTFAQFEREVIAERVRDKIAASKKRGKFCGGVPVLGYLPDPQTKKLYIVEKEAKTVRLLFEKYVLLGSLKEVVHEANMLKLKTKEWSSAKGRRHPAGLWNTGSLYRLLANPIYAGYVRHYSEQYEGEHKAIISRELWKRAQTIMRGNGCQAPRRRNKRQAFAGLVKCGHCHCAMTPTYTKRHGKKYYYYICQESTKNPDHCCPLKRIPAGDLEHAVLQQLSVLFQTPSILRAALAAAREQEIAMKDNLTLNRNTLQAQLDGLKREALTGNADFAEIKKAGERLVEVKRQLLALKEPVSADDVIAALSDTAGLWEFLFPGERHKLLRLVVRSIEIFENRVSLTLQLDGLKELAIEMSQSGYFNLEHPNAAEKLPEITQKVLPDGAIQLSMVLAAKKVAGHRRLVIPAPGSERLKQSAILRAIGNARKWMDMLINGKAKNISDLAERLGMKTPYVTRILRLNNLAPDIIEAINRGDEPDGLSLATLVKGFPDDWQDQRRELGFSAV